VDCHVLKEQGEIQSSVQEALSLLVDCFTMDTIDTAQLTQLEALVLQSIEQVSLSFSRSHWPHYASCLLVRLSVCPLRAPNSKNRRHKKAKVGVNIAHERVCQLTV